MAPLNMVVLTQQFKENRGGNYLPAVRQGSIGYPPERAVVRYGRGALRSCSSNVTRTHSSVG